jgi:hypothetical protein
MLYQMDPIVDFAPTIVQTIVDLLTELLSGFLV